MKVYALIMENEDDVDVEVCESRQKGLEIAQGRVKTFLREMGEEEGPLETLEELNNAIGGTTTVYSIHEKELV
jgi:hypothetical protein